MSDRDEGTAVGGRETDALVAERVMGWQAYAEQRGEYRGAVTWKPGEREPWRASRNPQPERYTAISGTEAVRIGFFGRGFPEYSTDIAAAWEVVERMQGNGMWLMLKSPFTAESDRWWAGFTPQGVSGWNGRPDFRADADTAPLAICRAALAAIAATHATSEARHDG